MCGDGEARQCHVQGTGARAPAGSPTPEFSQPGGFGGLSSVSLSCLLLHLMGTLQCTPESSCCPWLGCHTGSQQAGAVWLGVSMGVPEEEQTVTRECWETGLPSAPALPHPRAQGWLSMTSWDGDIHLLREVQLLHLFFLPGFPGMLTHHGWGKVWIPGFGV